MTGPGSGVVTISRLYGAGGVRVADAVATALGFRKVDRELVEQAGRRLGMDAELAASLDERVPALIEEVGLALAGGELPVAVPQPTVGDRALAEAVRRVIESLAAAGGYVILGRGGQAMLRDRPDAVHLQLVGTLEDRARRIMEWRGVSEDEGRAQCRRVDADRAAYVRRFADADINDPLLYDAILNTSRMGVDGATDAAVAIARHRLGPGRT
ncbi:MAG: AAA family ATPase [Actinomycetota bacterium]